MLSKRILTLVSLLLISSLLAGCFITPSIVSVTGVTLDQETLTLVAGGATGTLVETVEPADATDPRVTWSSSAPAVATVDDGVVTPLTAGTADITVITVDGGFTATCEVTVSAAPVAVTGVTLDEATLALTVGDAAVTLVAIVAPATATDTSVIWASSDEAVAIVALGVVTPLNAGISAITATTVDGGFVATCVVTVTAVEPEPEPELVLVGIEVDPDKMDLYVGESKVIDSVTATYEIRGYDADIDLEDCLFLTSDSEVAIVEGELVSDLYVVTVTAVDVGTTNILVSYENKFATLRVTVTEPKSMEIIADLPAFTEGTAEGIAVTASEEEFTVEVVANDDVDKEVKFYFTLPAGIVATPLPLVETEPASYGYTLELKDKVTGVWEDLGADATIFGDPLLVVLLRDPLADEVLSFRVTFGLEAAGTYEIMVVVKATNEDDPLCTKVITAVVFPAL